MTEFTGTVHLIHGMNDDGKNTVNRLETALADYGLKAIPFRYELNTFWDTFSTRKRDIVARSLLSRVQPGDHVVGHSNAARVIWSAMNQGARFDQCYLFAPAFSARKAWPEHGAKKINILHNNADKAILAGTLVPGHGFGALGAIGYQGPYDPRIHSHSVLYRDSGDENNHSWMWKPRWIGLISQYLAPRMKVPAEHHQFGSLPKLRGSHA